MDHQEAKNELVRKVSLGLDAEQFWQSEIGKSAAGKAREQIARAYAKFEDTDPSDKDTIAALQLDIRVARGFIEWLSDLISQGQGAQMSLSEDYDPE